MTLSLELAVCGGFGRDNVDAEAEDEDEVEGSGRWVAAA